MTAGDNPRDDIRQQLADALFRIDTDRDNPGGLAGRSYEDVADHLLPVVERIADQRAADELDAAADELPVTRRWLRDRAAALRGRQ